MLGLHSGPGVTRPGGEGTGCGCGCGKPPHHCTLGEEVHLEKNIFKNQFFKYRKIRTDILTVNKKFHNFLTKITNIFWVTIFFFKIGTQKSKRGDEGFFF